MKELLALLERVNKEAFWHAILQRSHKGSYFLLNIYQAIGAPHNYRPVLGNDLFFLIYSGYVISV